MWNMSLKFSNSDKRNQLDVTDTNSMALPITALTRIRSGVRIAVIVCCDVILVANTPYKSGTRPVFDESIATEIRLDLNAFLCGTPYM